MVALKMANAETCCDNLIDEVTNLCICLNNNSVYSFALHILVHSVVYSVTYIMLYTRWFKYDQDKL
jgi:hypothetical protein